MKKKSCFPQIVGLVLLAFLCFWLTMGFALVAGSFPEDLFRLEHLNFSNVIAVLLFGGTISCIVIAIAVLFTSQSVFVKVREYFFENVQKEEEKNK